MARPMLTAPRFVVSINGEHRCIAGIDGNGVLTVGLVFVRREAAGRASALLDGAARFDVGGLQERRHVQWLAFEEVFVGDEISIRILDGGPFDAPSPRGLRSTKQNLEVRRERLAKIGNVIPRRFQVLGNGEQFCIAGVESGVLSVSLTWVRRDRATRPPHSTESAEEWEGGEVDLHVGGLENDTHLSWFDELVDVGDEVTLRVLGPGPSDSPQHRSQVVHIPHEDQTVCSTARITLRKLVPDDLETVKQLLGNPQVMAHVQTPLDGDEVRAWLERHRPIPRPNRGMLLIYDNESIAPVGLTGVLDTEVAGKKLPIVQCFIDPHYWRQGYGTEAVWASIDWETASTRVPAFALIRPANAPALALARKLGMTFLRSIRHLDQEHMLFAATARQH